MRLLAAALLVLTTPTWAQKEIIFGSGKPPTYREEDLDRRFARSRVAKALDKGTDDPACQMLLGGLLAGVAEAAPFFHRRDENFSIDPHLVNAINTQLSTPRFPAQAYLMAMVRKVLIDRRLPDEWLATAEKIAPNVPLMDLAKLRYLNDGIRSIDSFLLSPPVLRDRYDVEVTRANSTFAKDAPAAFKDAYLDRDIAWNGGVFLVDAALSKKKKKKDAEGIEASLTWSPPPPPKTMQNFFESKKGPPPVAIRAILEPKQYVVLERLPKGRRLIVKGRLWDMKGAVTSVELRDALIFEDADWSRAVLGSPALVNQCPFAVNDLTGTAPNQPGGFAQ